MPKETIYITQEYDGFLGAFATVKALKSYLQDYPEEDVKRLKVHQYHRGDAVQVKSLLPKEAK